MKYFLFIFIATIYSCNQTEYSQSDIEIQKKEELIIVTMDSCQYVFYSPTRYDGGAAIVHHGNCHNPKHSK